MVKSREHLSSFHIPSALTPQRGSRLFGSLAWESMQFNFSELLCILPLSHQLFARNVAAVQHIFRLPSRVWFARGVDFAAPPRMSMLCAVSCRGY